MAGKCKNCGGTEIDVDPHRGDAVCTNCGTVLESSAIISEVQFEDTAHGGSSAIGQFVSADSRGGARGFGGTFNYGIGKESREITLQNARKSVVNLGQQLRLNQHCVDTAFNFYKMCLYRNLTRGRRNPLVVAACVYMTCRTEGTAHLLIDISDVLEINVYELGRTYVRLTEALSLNVPAVDPCLYILRYANCLEFGEKTQIVTMTALRLVQRMKKDNMHSGRRPSGLCGAALLMAARLHDFNRRPEDVIKVVKVHESTLRKRLLEFGETPSSCLTLNEFMTVDLEEEQDPPSFKAARLKDRERLQKVMEDEPKAFSELKHKIDTMLERKASKSSAKKKARKTKSITLNTEFLDAVRFCDESTVNVIKALSETAALEVPSDVVGSSVVFSDEQANPSAPSQGLGPSVDNLMLPVVAAGLGPSVDNLTLPVVAPMPCEQVDYNLADLDDDEMETYIMGASEVESKGALWDKVNAEYIRTQKEKEEKLLREKEEGKPEKKRKRTGAKKVKNNLSASTAGEAISKMLKEKKISSKINYDVLKDLNIHDAVLDAQLPIPELQVPELSSPSAVRPPTTSAVPASNGRSRKRPSQANGILEKYAAQVAGDVDADPTQINGGLDQYPARPRKARAVMPKLSAAALRKLNAESGMGFPLVSGEEPARETKPVVKEAAEQEVDEQYDFEEEMESIEIEAELTLKQMLYRRDEGEVVDVYGGGYDDVDY